MKRRHSLLLVLLLSGSFLFSGGAIAGSFTLNAIDDASASLINPWSYLGQTENVFTNPLAFSYLKFDLTAIASEPILSATLTLYQYSGFQPKRLGSSGTSVYLVTNDSWSDETISWLNKPSSTALLGSNLNGGNYVGWSSYALSMNAGLLKDPIWSMVIKDTVGWKLNEHNFYSSEYEGAPGYAPRLDIVTLDSVKGDFAAPVPEPATLFLLGTGLAGIAGFGRRKWGKK
jgi:hypothetical protein